MRAFADVYWCSCEAVAAASQQRDVRALLREGGCDARPETA
jgi:hypothetical protein